MQYDYLIVGAGLFGSVFAHEAHKAGKRVLVIDRRSHIGGNAYTVDINGIPVHRYGAHIFHTDDREVWDYINVFADFNRFTNSPVARYGDELFNLPFNMNTFHQMWGVITPNEAREKIEKQRREIAAEPQNLEEQAISLVGRDIYEKLIKGYTEKQWGRECNQLPPSIIKRLPVRFTYDNSYFNNRCQGIPIGGYTPIFDKLLNNIEVRLNTDFETVRYQHTAEKIVYTGAIDEYFHYCYGPLAYRSLTFEITKMDGIENYQGNAVVNYTDGLIPFTRIIEHKHFCIDQPEILEKRYTVISKEYPSEWRIGREPYYPINDDTNNFLLEKYQTLARQEKNVIFGGRLGQYQYLDMDKTVRSALDCAHRQLV